MLNSAPHDNNSYNIVSAWLIVTVIEWEWESVYEIKVIIIDDR
jgi:hypothetical protein